jgi:hypothetical protein
MESSPRRSWLHRKLYRNRLCAVTLAAMTWFASSWLLAQGPMPQYGRKPASVKGPRALGLVQLSPKGKARIIPIAIMMDGKFYDAGSYKAAPVPMALDFGIVYEGFRTGVSQGVFTITQPGQLNHVWIAEGTWTPAGERVPEKYKKYSAPVIADEDNNGPPVLHRRSGSDSNSGSDSKDKDKDKDQQKPATPPAPPTAASPAGAPTPPDAKAPATPETAKTPAPPETPKAAPSAAARETGLKYTPRAFHDVRRSDGHSIGGHSFGDVFGRREARREPWKRFRRGFAADHFHPSDFRCRRPRSASLLLRCEAGGGSHLSQQDA